MVLEKPIKPKKRPAPAHAIVYDCSGLRAAIEWIKGLDQSCVGKLVCEDNTKSLTLLIFLRFPRQIHPAVA